MMTRQQEREALKKIKNILADAGPDSYIGIAFSGCVEDAESNIENDWGLSMADRWQNAKRNLEVTTAEVKALRAERAELQAALDAMKVEISKRDGRIAYLEKRRNR